jgi:hypothetical protein
MASDYFRERFTRVIADDYVSDTIRERHSMRNDENRNRDWGRMESFEHLDVRSLGF